MEITLNKAKINGSGGLDLMYHESNVKKTEEDCDEPMLEKHAEAMQALVDVAIEICELPKNWKPDLTVVAMNLYGDEESRKVSISLKRKLKTGGPLVINSPRRHITCEEEFAKSALSDKHALLVDQAEQAALAYLAGERQTTTELDFEGEQDRKQEEIDYAN